MIFVDSSAFVAAFAATDANHTAALAIFRHVARANDRLVTTNLVAVETISLLQSRMGFDVAGRFATVFLKPIEVRIIDSALFDDARNQWLKLKRRRLSFVDCASFALMRQLEIERAFAFDRDFSDAGFALIEASP